jgi:hypothetical protein
VLLHGSLDATHLAGTKPTTLIQAYWFELQLCMHHIWLNMNMWRLIGVAGVEEQAVRARAQHGRHVESLVQKVASVS